MRERISIANMTSDNVNPLISSTPSNQFALAPKGNLAETQRGSRDLRNADALSQLVNNAAGYLGRQSVEEKELAEKMAAEQHAAYAAAVKAATPAVKSKLETVWQAVDMQTAGKSAEDKLKAFSESESVSEILNGYSAFDSDRHTLLDTFVSDKRKGLAIEANKQYYAQLRGSVLGSAPDILLAASTAKPADAKAMIDNLTKATSAAKGTAEDVYETGFESIKSLVSTGNPDDTMKASALFRVLMERKDIGAVGAKLGAYVPVLQKAMIEADNKLYRAEHMEYMHTTDKLIESQDLANFTTHLQQGVEQGFITEKRGRELYAAFFKSQDTQAAISQHLDSLLSGDKLTALYHMTSKDTTATDEAIVNKLMVRDQDGTYSFKDNATKLHVLQGMALNSDLKFTRVSSNLFGGLDTHTAMGKDGKPSPLLLKSLQNAHEAVAALGEGAAKAVMGDSRWRTYQIYSAWAGDTFDSTGLEQGAIFMRNIESVPKRALEMKEQVKAESALMSASDMSRSEVKEAIAEHKDLYDDVLRGANYNYGLAATLFNKIAMSQYADYDGNKVYGLKYVYNAINAADPYADPEDVLEKHVKEVAKEDGRDPDGVTLGYVDKEDNSKAMLFDKLGYVKVIDLHELFAKTAENAKDKAEKDVVDREAAYEAALQERNAKFNNNPYVQMVRQMRDATKKEKGDSNPYVEWAQQLQQQRSKNS